jgi:hypothetical protein
LILICLCGLVLPAAAQPATRPRLAIMDFSAPSGADVRGYADSSRRAWGDPGRMMAELLTTHFAKSGRFDVVERARLYQLLNEKQINVGGGLLGTQARQIGAELGVAAIVVGGYHAGSYGYEVAARIVATADGSTLAAENAIVPSDANWMDQSLAVLAAKLMAPWSQQRGYILDVFREADRLPLLMIDLGSAQGATVGRKLEVSTAGDPIVHPVTHEVLGTRDVLLATAAVVQTQREFSYARVLNRAGVTATPIKADGEGIDLGLERMQRVKLLDEMTDTADPDLSVLAVTQQLRITADIPGGKLLVDGKPTPLEDGAASVRLGAGTHLVELQVGQSKLSREVTVTAQGARPAEVTFRRGTLDTAATAPPPEPLPAAQGQTVLARTAPELTAADRPADQHLLALLPTAQEMDRQLQAQRDENVLAQFEAGLRALRYGYAKGSRSYLSIAATRFRDVTRLAPDLALGHFNLGLTQFYLDDFSSAQPAFAQAVKLDPSLRDDVPLLWWENFRQLPAPGRLAGAPAKDRSSWRWEVLPDAGLHYLNDKPTGLIVWQPSIATDQYVTDSRIAIRFRCLGGGGVSIGCRSPSGGAVILIVAGDHSSLSYFPTHDRCQEIGQGRLNLDGGWHVAELSLVGTQARAGLDGALLYEKTLPSAGSGVSGFTLWGPGEVLVDWVQVTRN